MENNILLKVTAGDENDGGILYQGSAEYREKDDVRILKYKDRDNVENQVRFSPAGCMISRKGDQNLKMYLMYSGDSYIQITSELGEFRVPVDPDFILCKENELRIRYAIPENEEEETVFEFAWKILGRLA